MSGNPGNLLDTQATQFGQPVDQAIESIVLDCERRDFENRELLQSLMGEVKKAWDVIDELLLERDELKYLLEKASEKAEQAKTQEAFGKIQKIDQAELQKLQNQKIELEKKVSSLEAETQSLRSEVQSNLEMYNEHLNMVASLLQARLSK
jgi:hypothetical protein